MPSNVEDNVSMEEEENELEDEFAVEEIIDKRIDKRTGATEYLVKWENYDHSENTWEPVEHLKCPDLIVKFDERVRKEQKKTRELEKEKAAKRRRSSSASTQESQSKRVRKEDRQGSSMKLNEPEILLEENFEDAADDELENNDDASSSTTETHSSVDGDSRVKKTGFARGLPIETIVGSCTDDDQNVGFFIKWKGAEGMDLVDVVEIEERAPRELCKWYRNRLYTSIKNNPATRN